MLVFVCFNSGYLLNLFKYMMYLLISTESQDDMISNSNCEIKIEEYLDSGGKDTQLQL